MGLLNDENWELVASVERPLSFQETSLVVGEELSSRYLLCKVSTTSPKPTWLTAGKVWASWSVLGEDHYTDCYYLRLNRPRLITVPLLSTEGYSLIYEPPKWFADINFTIHENKNMALYTDNSQPDGTASTATSATVAVASNTTPSSILAANVNRKGYSIRNRGAKAAIIGFSSTFAATTAFLSLAANAVYESEKNYTGDLLAMTTANNTTTDLVVTEFT
jgi:hypothetical protein